MSCGQFFQRGNTPGGIFPRMASFRGSFLGVSFSREGILRGVYFLGWHFSGAVFWDAVFLGAVFPEREYSEWYIFYDGIFPGLFSGGGGQFSRLQF